MAKKQMLNVEEKLRILYKLQLIDSKIDEIKSIRGELPLEIEDLKNEVEGLNKRLENINQEIKKLEGDIGIKKTEIKEAEELSKKYKEQQKNIRNNREFESLSKEIEYQDLEIQFANKKINDFSVAIEHKKELIERTNEVLQNKNQYLENKTKELEIILEETKNEETKVRNMFEKLSKEIPEDLLKSYQKIRSRVKNGLAVVSFDRGAAKGSFLEIPPQAQIEIAQRTRIYADEYSGRILVDMLLAEEEKTAFENKLKK